VDTQGFIHRFIEQGSSSHNAHPSRTICRLNHSLHAAMGFFRRSTAGSPVAAYSSSASVSPRGLDRRSSERANMPGIRRMSTAGSGRGLTPEDGVRRRSSTFSQYSFGEAQQDFQEEILDPGPNPQREPRTWKSWLPIMFASVPPIAGLFFKNGTAFFSDLILLILATIFLHWSITAPW